MNKCLCCRWCWYCSHWNKQQLYLSSCLNGREDAYYVPCWIKCGKVKEFGNNNMGYKAKRSSGSIARENICKVVHGTVRGMYYLIHTIHIGHTASIMPRQQVLLLVRHCVMPTHPILLTLPLYACVIILSWDISFKTHVLFSIPLSPCIWMCWNNHLVHPPLWDEWWDLYYYSLFSDNKTRHLQADVPIHPFLLWLLDTCYTFLHVWIPCCLALAEDCWPSFQIAQHANRLRGNWIKDNLSIK